jgi:microsomal epoxide hydrolase
VSQRIEPFRVEVPDDVLADLRARLARTRFPITLADSGWDYGTDVDYLRRLVEYWRGVLLSERCVIPGHSGHAARLRSSMVAGS